MVRKLCTLVMMLVCFIGSAQETSIQIDTNSVYKDREDSLQATVFVAHQKGNYLSKHSNNRVESISSAGLRKMACCNLAESFENSASVSVGYSDAVTGARQIRLLGLSGIYVQMLDENRPVMRGLSAPFGLTYVPSPWLESIQIAKGAASVINGAESMAGTINMEHKKPSDEKPLFLNYSIMNDTKMDLNLVSCLQTESGWSTALFGHVSGNLMAMDENGDGFVDDPKQLQVNLGNRWLYYTPDGVEIRFGARGIMDKRQGGQLEVENGWISDIENSSADAFVKVGIPVGEEGSVAVIADYNYQKMVSSFGPLCSYDASQHSAFANLLYADEIDHHNKFTLGLSTMLDGYKEDLSRPLSSLSETFLGNAGAFGEYTFNNHDIFTAIVGLRADYYFGVGLKATPRLTLKYAPNESFVFRVNAGRGLRYSTPIIDNIGVLSTNKILSGNFDHTLEDSWIGGGNATWYIGGSSSNYLSVDFFHTDFAEQKIIDYDSPMSISFYDLSSLESGRSYTNTFQADLSFEPVERFTVTTTFRYTDARQTFKGRGLVEKPMTSRYKGVLNLQYALPLNKWIFDCTASLNGPCRLYEFMGQGDYSPVYPLLYMQVTKRFKGVEVYLGGENLTSFTQKDVIVADPSLPGFDASCIWGPIMGAKLYAGVRLTIWKL